MVDHFSAYIYQKRGFYYFSRRVPKQLQHCRSKQRIVLALNTKSRARAIKHARVICQRLDERWLPMPLDAMGLNNVFKNDVRALPSHRLFGPRGCTCTRGAQDKQEHFSNIKNVGQL
tara:strand:- start:1336 stop:1686 length:351 start_codon:yes stop_codon:yes gene_type:complete